MRVGYGSRVWAPTGQFTRPSASLTDSIPELNIRQEDLTPGGGGLDTASIS
jgi:hypothetical protein